MSNEEKIRHDAKAYRAALQEIADLNDISEGCKLARKVLGMDRRWGCFADHDNSPHPDGCILDNPNGEKCDCSQELIDECLSREDCPEWREY